jgi:hypothetical protein
MNILETELLYHQPIPSDVFIKTLKMGDIQTDNQPHTDSLPLLKKKIRPSSYNERKVISKDN